MQILIIISIRYHTNSSRSQKGMFLDPLASTNWIEAVAIVHISILTTSALPPQSACGHITFHISVEVLRNVG